MLVQQRAGFTKADMKAQPDGGSLPRPARESPYFRRSLSLRIAAMGQTAFVARHNRHGACINKMLIKGHVSDFLDRCKQIRVLELMWTTPWKYRKKWIFEAV